MRVIPRFLSILIREVTEAIDEEANRKLTEWVREWLQRRNTCGASALLLTELAMEDVEEYKKCLRMMPINFNELLGIISDKIKREDTMMRESIPSRLKLEVTLNFLATGNSYRSLSHFFRVSIPAISKFVPEVCEAISEVLNDSINVPCKEEWKRIAEGLERSWNFRNCCGAIDGKHVIIKALPNSGSEYFNYKGSHSIVLMAVVDHRYRFVYVNVGFKGSKSDGVVFQNCALYEALEQNLLPDGLFLVGDDAFPLKMYLMKPYTGYRKRLTVTEQAYNYRLTNF